jgi:hypothetical protein
MSHPFMQHRIETAPVLNLFGPLAQGVGALVRIAPELALRLTLAPTRAVHATAIFMHSQATAGIEPEVTANSLLEQHPRDLLRQTLPKADARLYKMLDRAALPAWSLAEYEALEELPRSEVSDLIPDRGKIMPSSVINALAILRADPVVRHARRALAGNYDRERLETVVQVLHRMGLLRDLAALPDGSGASAVARRAAADLGRAEAPAIEFPIAPGWALVRRLADLWAHGERMNLCLRPGLYGAGDYAVSMLMGRSIFLYCAEPELLVQFRHLLVDTWTLAECSAARHARVPDGPIRELTTYVESAGIALLPVLTGAAMDSILRPLRSKDRDVPDLLEPEFAADDEGGDDAADLYA